MKTMRGCSRDLGRGEEEKVIDTRERKRRKKTDFTFHCMQMERRGEAGTGKEQREQFFGAQSQPYVPAG